MSISPVLDQPQSIDYLDLAGGPINRLANHELICWLDADCNPQEVYWPWANRRYVRSIVMRVLDWQEGELVPLVTRFFPGHQETIAGSEGVIVTKRLCIPLSDQRRPLALLAVGVPGGRRPPAAPGDRHRLGRAADATHRGWPAGGAAQSRACAGTLSPEQRREHARLPATPTGAPTPSISMILRTPA